MISEDPREIRPFRRPRGIGISVVPYCLPEGILYGVPVVAGCTFSLRAGGELIGPFAWPPAHKIPADVLVPGAYLVVSAGAMVLIFDNKGVTVK